MNEYEALQIVDSPLDHTADGVAEALQCLINSGLINSLPGRYGRMAQDFINAGLCTPLGDLIDSIESTWER